MAPQLGPTKIWAPRVWPAWSQAFTATSVLASFWVPLRRTSSRHGDPIGVAGSVRTRGESVTLRQGCHVADVRITLVTDCNGSLAAGCVPVTLSNPPFTMGPQLARRFGGRSHVRDRAL
jgi:hypothetical protein